MKTDPIDSFTKAGTVKRRWMAFGLGVAVGLFLFLTLYLVFK